MQILCVLLFALKLAQLALAGVFMDESYYWMWGQHPALSYYDHPPLNAWLLGLSSSLFGWNLFALRLPVALTFLADILALWLIARRIGGDDWRGHFWLTLLLFFVTPLFWMVTSFGLPDHTLLTALLFSIYFFFRFFQDRANGAEGATRDLLLGALFLGLATLSKYNAAFLGVGIGLFVLFNDRALMGQLRLWLAALLAIAMQAPVVVWNLTTRFASWNFILEGRHNGLAQRFDGVYPLLLGILVFILPFLIWPMGKFAIARSKIPGIGFARSAFIVSTLAIVALAFTTLTLFHWNLIAYAAMLPFLVVYLRPRWLFGLQVLVGGALAVALSVNYSITPVSNVRGWADEGTSWVYGWDEIAAATATARSEHEIGFIAATDYTTASLFAFALRDRDVVSLAPRQDQYDYWFDPAAHAGQDALLYVDRWRPLNDTIRRKFDTVDMLAEFPVRTLAGDEINIQRLYLAKGFRPDG